MSLRLSRSSRSSDDSSSSSPSSGALAFLRSDKVYGCSKCGVHLVDYGDIVSRAFHGRSGRAYLFENVKNVTVGESENRQLMTGLHTVADISCSGCGSVLGWKYERAYEASQRYKENKFILEKARLVKDGDW